MFHYNSTAISIDYSLILRTSMCHAQLFVKQSNAVGGGIHHSGSTISSQKLVMSPTAMPPEPSLMNVMVVKENKGTLPNPHEREHDFTTLPQHLHPEMLPVAAALSASNLDDASNETLSSSKDRSYPSPKSAKSSSYKGKSNRDQTSNISKQNGKKKTSKLKGNIVVGA